MVATDRSERVNQIFADAIEIAPEQRAGFVAQRCGGDSDLAGSVLRLLSGFEKLGSFLDVPAGTPPPGVDPVLAPGRVLNRRFEILEVLGEGGMGIVYRARDLTLGEVVAVKTIRQALAASDEAARRFRDEIRLARRVAHPNVCRIFDCFTDETETAGRLFLTMEYLAGQTLDKYLARRGMLDFEEIVSLGSQIAAGLDAAHQAGVIHRDLKPGNIFLCEAQTGERRVVIGDFGLARTFEPGENDQTAAGALVGSPNYMAPEQFFGEGITSASDIYSFGLILYRMAAGRRPFPDEPLIRAAVRRVVEDAPPLAAAPSSLAAAVAMALARDPAARPATAGGVLELIAQPAKDREKTPNSRRRFLRTAAGIAAGGALVSASIAGWRYYRYERPVPDKPVLMIAPFKVFVESTDGADRAAVEDRRRSVELSLARQLAQSGHLRLLESDGMRAAWLRMKGQPVRFPSSLDDRTAREIAMRGGAQLIAFGELMKAGDSWRLGTRLELMSASPAWPARRFEPRAPFSGDGDEGLHSIVAEASAWIRASAGESASEIRLHDRPPQELTTASWEALKEYSAGDDAWRESRDSPGGDRGAAAEAHLRRALEIDPGFAMASARLADIEMASGRVDAGLADYRSAIDAINRKNLTDRESLRTQGLFALDTGQYAAAEKIFSRYAVEYPADGLPLFYKAGAVQAQGRVEEALNLYVEGGVKDPGNYSYPLNRAFVLLQAGRLDEAERDCERSGKNEPRDWTEQLRGAIRLSRFDLAGVEGSLRRLRENGTVPFQSKAFLLTACLRAEQEREDEAEALLRDGLNFDAARGLPADSANAKRLALATLLIRRKRGGEAVSMCREVAAGFFASSAAKGLQTALDAHALMARAGDVRAATRFLGSLAAQRALEEWPGYRYRVQRLKAEIALARGRAGEAFELMRSNPFPVLLAPWPDTLVRAAIGAGMAAEANAPLRHLLTNPGAYWLAADLAGPGFMQEAIELAARSGLEIEAARLRKLLGSASRGG